MASASFGGAACSSSSVDAPMRIGKRSRPPSPKVNARGGEPQKMSVSFAWRMCRGKQSQMASTSRCTCIVPFAFPVVPEVKAMSATSSAAVSTAANVGAAARIRSSRESPDPLPEALYATTRGREASCAQARSTSCIVRASTSASDTFAFSIT